MIIPCVHVVENRSGRKWGGFKVSGFRTMYGFCLPKYTVYVCLLRDWPRRPFPSTKRGLIW